MSASTPWWQGAVVYQIYPRSFSDSNGDGVGDLRGVIARLDYLEWLGVDAVWLSPIHPSPNRDFGYDVSDFVGVHPELGTLEDVDRLIADAGSRGIRVLMDLVPGHTSDRHPWFEEARRSCDSARRSWYIWADPGPGGEPPEGEGSTFGGPAWTLDEGSGQYYHHAFLPEQADLNWLNDEVRDAFDEIMRFWFDRGVAGFRIDVVHGLVKDARGAVLVPEIHDVLRRWRTLADTYEPPRILVGETWVMELEQLMTFYGSGRDELDLAFNFPFVFAGFERIRAVVEETQRLLPAGAALVWALSNHDVVRFPTRMCDGEEARIRCALLLLLTLPGTSFLYYGDELGMLQAEIATDRVLDVDDRDGARTPMPWEEGVWRDPWLPVSGGAEVAAQRADPSSTLSLARALVHLRRDTLDLRSDAYESLRAAEPVWGFRRGPATTVLANLSGESRAAECPDGVVLLATNSARDGEKLSGSVSLAPWEALVVQT